MRNKLPLAAFLLLFFAVEAQKCRPALSAEKRIVKATIAVKALVTKVYGTVAELWLLDVYKGEDKLAAALGLPGKGPDAVFHLKDQRVNVSHFGDPSQCWNELLTQRTYVILLQPHYGHHHDALFKARYDDPLGAAIEFTTETERKLQKALGWSDWSEWSSCSQTCDGGQQERHRECLLKSSNKKKNQQLHYPNRRSSTTTKLPCGPYNAEKRNCNSFSCSGAVNTLSIVEERYFKPSPSAFLKVAGRGPDAWQFRPGSYFLLPFQEAFGRKIPGDFTIFLSIKPTQESEGILFSLNARNSRQEYISLELRTEGRLELVHSLPNGSKIIDIPARINDGHWHQLAISIHGGSSVRTYLDCHWITTQVLHQHALKVPEDTDLIVGYMFQGDLEQLTVVDETLGGVSEQCSPNKMPFQREMRREKKNVKSFKIKDYLDEEYVDLDWAEKSSSTTAESTMNSAAFHSSEWPRMTSAEASSAEEGSGEVGEEIDDEDEHEGSSKNEAHLSEITGSGDFEWEWSAWSQCSQSCGKGGVQTRIARCVDNGLLEECLMASRHSSRPPKTESRPCKRQTCPPLAKQQQQSGWIPVKYETVTKVDVDNVRQHLRPPPPLLNISSWELNLMEKPTSDHPEEHTNLIPHIPNYWTPADTYPENKENGCWCANGGTCEYHNHIYGHSLHHASSESATCKCRKGYAGKHCERALCRPGCANGGLCVAPDVCSCPDGFTGARCQTAFCHPGCQNGGSCVAPFKCDCPPGVTGAFCQDYSCTPHCANGGICIGHNMCSCPHGFSGPDCQDKTCTLHCENGGVCTMPDNKCKCREGYYGARCHKKICRRYVGVREPHSRAYKQMVDVEYETLCENGRPGCTKTRPGYKTVFRTVYKTTYKCATDEE